ncbi:MAG: multicopper oxidase family protein [Myxococcota bacterium]
MRHVVVLGLGLLGAACGMGGSVFTPPPSPGDFDVKRLDDLNPEPGVVEVELEARVATLEYLPGQPTEAWTYNGTVPGPALEANVGDEVVVHFRNNLPEETTIHWHGLRVSAEMDGVPTMQTPVPPGGTFDYRFTVKDAGTYWYHPHVRSDVQVERGLYGPIVVRGPQEPTLTRERILMLDDIRTSSGLGMGMGGMGMGEQVGNLMLVNGRARPIAEVRAGERERWRIINVANARYFRLTLPEHPFTVLGLDSGFLETPQEREEMLLVPGERLDVVVAADALPGQQFELVARPYNQGHMNMERVDLPLMRVHYSLAPPVNPPAVPQQLDVVEDPGTPSVVQRLRLTEDMGHGMGGTFRINDEVYPDITPLQARVGVLQQWDVVNDTFMDHPFHLHGFRFQVVGGVDGLRAWKDTVNVPAGRTVQLLIPFDGEAGRWMYHCHILQHAENGMMGEVVVAAP